jgi:hypothetical protein
VACTLLEEEEEIVFKIAIKFISMRNPEISYCLYSEKFK